MMSVHITLVESYAPMTDEQVQQLTVYENGKPIKYLRFPLGEYSLEKLAEGLEELARALRVK